MNQINQNNQISFSNELVRKSLHFCLILLPILFYFSNQLIFNALLIAISSIVITFDYYRRKNPIIQKFFTKIFAPILRNHEINSFNFTGLSHVLAAASLNFLIFPEEIAVASFSIFVISDGLAAIIGRKFPSEPFFEKSLNGSIAFLISGLVILVSCGVIYHSDFWFYFFGIFCVGVVTIIEARPSLINIDDNFSIPMIFSASMLFFYFVWNFSY
jgi:dolichol kinase